jgi:hypothetical protein
MMLSFYRTSINFATAELIPGDQEMPEMKVAHILHRCYGFTLISVNQLNPCHPRSKYYIDDLTKLTSN